MLLMKTTSLVGSTISCLPLLTQAEAEAGAAGEVVAGEAVLTPGPLLVSTVEVS
jgi:hypothetical protein